MAKDSISNLAAEMNPLQEEIRKGISAATWNMLGGGVVGLEHPNEGVREWQAEHPWLNLASELAGFGGFYGAGAKALKATKYRNVLKGLASGEKLAEAPFKTRALQEMALMAPIEASRQVVGAVAGELGDYEGPTLGERGIEGALNTAFGGVVAGTLGKIASGGRKIRLPESLRDLTTEDSFQVNLRKVRDSLEGLSDSLEQNQVRGLASDLENKIKSEWRENYITELADDPEKRFGRLNTLWKGTQNNPSYTLNINKDTGFKSLASLETVTQEVAEAVKEPRWLEYAQFPRIVAPKSAQARAYVDDTLVKALSPVGDGWYLGKEKKGLYVLAKKIHEQEGANRYLLFKTDNPGKFLPEQAHLKAIADRNAWRDPDTIINPTEEAGSLLNEGLQFYNLLGKGVKASEAGNSRIWEASKEGVSSFAQATGLAKVGSRIAESELVGNSISEFKRLFSPTALQFKNSPEARKVYATWQYFLDKAKRKSYAKIWGEPTSEGQSLFGTITKGSKVLQNSLGKRFEDFFSKNPEEFKAFLQKFYSNQSTDDILAEGILRPESQGFLREISAIDKANLAEINSTAKALHIDEEKLFTPLNSHRGMSRFWKGSLRQEVLDDQGRIVTIFGGNNKKGLIKNAERLIEEMKKDGRELRLGDFWIRSPEIDSAKLKRLNPDLLGLSEEYLSRLESGAVDSRMPGFAKSRTGIEGYHIPKTPKEFLDDLAYSYQMRFNWLARESAERLTRPTITALGIQDPQTAVALEEKLSVMKGEQGVLSTYVNKLADKVLAPVMGSNSASRCVDAFNSAHAILDLGFANISYVLANILQPITTVLPQLSMLHSCPEALQWAYDGIPLISRSGKGTLANIFSPLKMMKEGLKLMAHPESEAGFKEFADWAVREGIISPQFTEAYVGQTSQIGSAIRDAWKRGEFVDVIKEISSYGPRMSEQLSRGYAMSVGYKFFNSFKKEGLMTTEQVYQAVKKFTENTMFQYAASDRATVLQGPVGRAWGLFKNWTMHYAWWQMEYLDAAARKGCFAPLVYSNLATMSLGGLGASELGGVAQGFAEWMGDDKMSNLVYDRWGDTPTSNFILYGLPGLAGWSLKGQVNSPFSDPGEEIQRFMGFVYANRLKAAWNAVGAGIDAWATSGRNPLADENTQRQLARAFAPKMFYRSMQMTGDALYTISGTKIMDGLTASEKLAYQIFNLPSTRIAQGMEISSEIWKDKEKRALLTSKYAEAMSHALEAEDGVLMQRILERALVDGVDVPSMINNAQKRMKNSYLSPLERNKDYYGVWGSTAQALDL